MKRSFGGNRLPAAVLGLVVLLAACETPTDPGSGDTPAGSRVPSTAIGSWKGGLLSSSNFWDDHTGQYLGAAMGISVLFHFEEGGRYRQATYILNRTYTCVRQIWSATEGVVTFEASTFTVTPTSGRYKITDSCDSSVAEERALRSHELTGATYLWTAARGPNGEQQLIIGPNESSMIPFVRE